MKNQSPAQLLADFLCKRMGKKKGLPTPPGYWNQPEWKIEYKRKILDANKFLKVYPLEVIMTTLNSTKFKWVFSLYCPGLEQALEEELSKYNRNQTIQQINIKKEDSKDTTPTSGEAPVIFTINKTLGNLLD